jgi:elongation factor P
MESVQATRLRKGMLVKMNAELYRVLDVTHLTPGKGKAFVQSRMRSVKTGTLLDHKFRSADTIERAVLDDREMQFSYRDGETFHFMDLETYEQIEMSADSLGDSVHFLLPEATIKVSLFEGEAVGLDMPLTVDLKVEETAPAIKGATRDWSRCAGAAVHQRRRPGAGEHRDRRVSVARLTHRSRAQDENRARQPVKPGPNPWVTTACCGSSSTLCCRRRCCCLAAGSWSPTSASCCGSPVSGVSGRRRS